MIRLFLAAMLLPAIAWAETGRVSSFTLDNGMQAIVIEDNRAPIVTHMVWYNVGAADEPPGLSGIAHFLEHLMFKGTEKLAVGEFSQTVKENGGVDNAFTSYDYTGYFQRVARDRLSLMMSLEADRMVNLRLDPREVETERAVVLEERKSRTDSDPGALFSEQRRAAQFLNHPYARPVVGWRHEIEAMTIADLLAFYKAHYAPNNATLIVAGDVTPNEVRALAEEHYGPIPSNPAIVERVRAVEPPQISARRLSYSDPRERQPYLVRTYIAPKRESGNQKEAAAVAMLAYLMGGTGVTSVLGEKLQLEEQVAVFTQAWYDSMSFDPDTFGLYAQPRPGVSLEELEAAIDATIRDLIENGFDEAKLDRLKTQIAAQETYALDDQSGIARRYGRAVTAGLSVADVKAWPQVLQEVTVEDVVAAARSVFDINRSVTGWMVVEEATQ
ncbi:MAG: pitrilysin family protein [Pseudomonadota bacterium]